MLMGGIEDDICNGSAEAKVDLAGLEEMRDWYDDTFVSIVGPVIEWTYVV